MRKISIIILAVVLALFAITACNDSVGDLFGFELTFNANGGTGTMANVSVKGSSTTAPANKFTRDGYTFVSWNTEADGSGTEYKVGAKIEGASTLSVRLYAQWSANTYSITVGPKASAEVSSYTISDSIQNIALTLSPAAGDDFVSWTVTGNATVSGNTLTIPAGAYGDITVVPTFKAQVYAVSFNRNGGIINAGEISTYTYGTGATLPSDLTKTGFTFGGWYDNEECKGTAVAAITTTDLGDKTFYAKWNVNDYTVTLNANGGTIIEGDVTSYTYGVGATLPANVTKEGCTFAGWFDNEGCTGDAVVSISVAETGSKVFYAKWTANTYAVTFVKNGGTINEGAITGYTYGEVTALPTNVTKSGHTFAGWFTDEKYTGSAVYTIAADETGAKTFYAKWIATGYSITCIPTEYGFAYGLYEEYTVNDGDIYIQLTAVPHSGYALYGYEVTGGAYTDVNDEYLVIPAGTTGDITVTPLFDKVVYFITVNKSVRGTASAEAISYVISDTDTEVALDATPDTGFALFDWSLEADEAVYVKDNILVIPAGIVGDVYVTPNFLPIFNVTLNKNGGTVDEGYDVTEYFFAEETVLPTAEHFKRTGNVFGGWFDNDQYEGNPVTVITRGTSGDKTFYAKWTPNKFKVEFDKNATSATGTMAVQNFTYDVAQNLTALGYSRTGYTFAGWNTVSTPTTEVPGTAYANQANVKNLTDVDGATVKLYAQWTANTYTVKFNANGGSGTMADQSFTYDVTQALTEKAFTRTGHTFANWNSVATPTQQTPGVSYADKAEVSNLTAVKDGVYNLYAQWTANTYTVTLNANGGTIAQGKNVTSYTYGVGATLPTAADITKTGYTFGGWYDNEQCTGTAVTTISTTDTGNKTFYAKWTAITYTVKFDKNAEAATGTIADQVFTYDVTQALTANSFKRIGHYFNGWNTVATPTEQEPGTAYANKKEVKNLATTQDAVVTLYAQWELTPYDVTITSGSEGYTVTPSASKYTYTLDQSGTVITLDIEGPIPTIDHYLNNSPATANVEVDYANSTVTIKSGSYGNIDIVCYFITDYKTVTFKANGGIGDDTTQNVPTDDYAKLDANTFTHETLFFDGWALSADGDVVYEDQALICITEDTDLYAHWVEALPITEETTVLLGGVKYTLADDVTNENRLTIDGSEPVTINLPEGKTLTLSKGLEVVSGQSLVIEGEGTLNATGSSTAAGIGGGSNGSGGNITINGGIVNANGGLSGAGIGGGVYSSVGTVTINGGTVNAVGGFRAAGIGGGDHGAGGTVTINGGTVTATGGDDAVGIGKGFNGSSNGTLELDGVAMLVRDDNTTWVAYDGTTRTRYMKTTDTVAITFKPNGATETEDVLQYVPAGYDVKLEQNPFTHETLFFAGWALTAEGEAVYADQASVNLTEDTTLYAKWIDAITLDGTYGGSGKKLTGGLRYTIADDLTLPGRLAIDGTSEVTLILPEGKTLTLEKGLNVVSGQSLVIEGEGTLNATGSSLAAGIGGDYCDKGGTITIKGGTINATGGDCAAGIGGGMYGEGGDVTILGGTVTAFGDSANYVVAIGHGYFTTDEDDGTLEIGDGLGLFGGDDEATAKFLSAPVEAYEGDRPVYMKAEATEYVTVTFNANDTGATGTMDPQSVPKGSAAALSANAYSKTDWYFAGWNTKADGTGNSYKDKADITISAGITLYAQWSYAIPLDDTYGGSTGNKLVGGKKYSIYDTEVTIPGRLEIDGSDTVTIVLPEDGILTLSAGISVLDGNSLVIDGNGLLNATGTEGCAAIGGTPTSVDAGTITINGGTITVQGGQYAAGIGGGCYVSSWTGGKSGTITINNGSITAQGGQYAAGIGLGTYGDVGGTITITGGSVTATGGTFAAAIGGGYAGNAESISITGGTVVATGGKFAAGIGGGWGIDGGNISITGGSVSATGGEEADGIGNGQYASDHGTLVIGDGMGLFGGADESSTAFISGQTTSYEGKRYIYMEAVEVEYVTVTFNANGGAGTMGTQSVISDVDCKLDKNKFTKDSKYFAGWNTKADGSGTSYTNGAAINVSEDAIIYAQWSDTPVYLYITPDTTELLGGETYTLADNVTSVTNAYRLPIDDNMPVTIYIPQGKTLTLTAGIQVNSDQTLNLDGGGTIQVSTDVEGRAAIGGDSASPDAGSIFIGSGKTGNWFTVEATGGAGAAAIGGGWNNQGGGSVNQIEIFAGAVTVNGGFKGMGLGVGYQGNGGLIEIWNGYVEAYGGESGAGISVGAVDEYGSNIAIFGGRVEAHGGDYGAGIGGYENCGGSAVLIFDGILEVYGGTRASAIGGGYYGNGGDVAIYGGTVFAACDSVWAESIGHGREKSLSGTLDAGVSLEWRNSDQDDWADYDGTTRGVFIRTKEDSNAGML